MNTTNTTLLVTLLTVVTNTVNLTNVITVSKTNVIEVTKTNFVAVEQPVITNPPPVVITNPDPVIIPPAGDVVIISTVDQLNAAFHIGLVPGRSYLISPGTYVGNFTITTSGTKEAPVRFRPLNSGQVIIRGDQPSDVLNVQGANVWIEDLTIDSISSYANTDPSPPAVNYASATAENTKLINCRIRNTGQGIFANKGCNNMEIYGCYFYYVGKSPKDHGVYAHNASSTRRVFKDCFLWNNQEFAFHLWGNSDVRNMVVDGCVLWCNANAQVMFGGALPMQDMAMVNSHLYYPPTTGEGKANALLNFGDFSGTAGHRGLLVANNMIVNGQGLNVDYWNTDALIVSNRIINPFSGMKYLVSNRQAAGATSVATFSNNVYNIGNDARFITGPLIGSTVLFANSWRASGRDTDSTFTTGFPIGSEVFYKPNLYNTNKCWLVVYNWQMWANVDYTLPETFVGTNDAITVKWLMNLDTPINVVRSGRTISLPMTLSAKEQPFRQMPDTTNPMPVFGVFEVTKN